MMYAGRGNLERALGAFLSFDVAQVEQEASASWTFGDGRDSTWVPLKWLAIWISEWAATIWISGLAHAASAPHAAGQIRPSSRELAPIAAGKPPSAPEPNDLILASNGILNLKTGELIPHSGRYFVAALPDWNYDPDA